MEYLENSLSALNCRVFAPVPGSLCAWFDFRRDSAIAFRADCDALPITECTGADYSSTHPGRMHACAHDGHMAIALELARRLSEMQELPHNVLLIFQPAEESPGGAEIICDTGLLEEYRVKAVFGLHLWPALTAGQMFSRPGHQMSRTSELTVDVYGRSSHIANPVGGLDALAAAAEFYQKVRALEQTLPPDVLRLLNFGQFHSGTARNALSAHAHLEGSLRTFRDDIFDYLRDGLYRIAAEVEQSTGCTVKIHMSKGYPAVWNDEATLDRVRQIIPVSHLDKPSMTSEDFSWYQKHVPGVFFFLGLGDVPALHSSDFDFDESILTKGANLFQKLAENFT